MCTSAGSSQDALVATGGHPPQAARMENIALQMGSPLDCVPQPSWVGHTMYSASDEERHSLYHAHYTRPCREAALAWIVARGQQ